MKMDLAAWWVYSLLKRRMTRAYVNICQSQLAIVDGMSAGNIFKSLFIMRWRDDSERSSSVARLLVCVVISLATPWAAEINKEAEQEVRGIGQWIPYWSTPNKSMRDDRTVDVSWRGKRRRKSHCAKTKESHTNPPHTRFFHAFEMLAKDIDAQTKCHS